MENWSSSGVRATEGALPLRGVRFSNGLASQYRLRMSADLDDADTAVPLKYGPKDHNSNDHTSKLRSIGPTLFLSVARRKCCEFENRSSET
jgi:hypothetical protein